MFKTSLLVAVSLFAYTAGAVMAPAKEVTQDTRILTNHALLCNSPVVLRAIHKMTSTPDADPVAAITMAFQDGTCRAAEMGTRLVYRAPRDWDLAFVSDEDGNIWYVFAHLLEEEA